MITECPACSRIGTERSNPQGEARLDELASRNASELDSASLRKAGVAMLPDWLQACRHRSRDIRTQPMGSPG